MAIFVTKCGERWHTQTILKESNHAIQKAVNELVDKRLGRRKSTALLRRIIRIEASRRLVELFKSSIPQNPGEVDVRPIVSFYESLRDSTEGRLDELRLRKHSDSVSPEPNDLIILAECVELNHAQDLSLVSGDGHFVSFKQEIFDKFGVEVLDFYDIRKFV